MVALHLHLTTVHTNCVRPMAFVSKLRAQTGSGVVGQGQLPNFKLPENILLLRKFSSTNSKFGVEKTHFGEMGNNEISSTVVSSVRNLQLSVGKLQPLAPPSSSDTRQTNGQTDGHARPAM